MLSEQFQLLLKFWNSHVADVMCRSSFPSCLKLNDIIDEFVDGFVLRWVTVAAPIRQVNQWTSRRHVVGDLHLDILDVVRPSKFGFVFSANLGLSISFVGNKSQELLRGDLQELRSGEDVGFLVRLVVDE